MIREQRGGGFVFVRVDKAASCGMKRRKQRIKVDVSDEGANMDLNNIPEDLKARARECSSAEELAALAREAGIELTDEELESLSGGVKWSCALYKEGCPTNEPRQA